MNKYLSHYSGPTLAPKFIILLFFKSYSDNY